MGQNLIHLMPQPCGRFANLTFAPLPPCTRIQYEPSILISGRPSLFNPARRTDEIVRRGLEAASYDWTDAFRADGCDKAGGISAGLRGVDIVCCRL